MWSQWGPTFGRKSLFSSQMNILYIKYDMRMYMCNIHMHNYIYVQVPKEKNYQDQSDDEKQQGVDTADVDVALDGKDTDGGESDDVDLSWIRIPLHSSCCRFYLGMSLIACLTLKRPIGTTVSKSTAVPLFSPLFLDLQATVRSLNTSAVLLASVT